MTQADSDSTQATASAPADGVDPFERQNYLAAIDTLRPLAEQDDIRAQCQLGVALAKAEGGDPQRQIEAVKWMDLCIRRYDNPDSEANETAHQLTDEFIRQFGWEIVGEGRYRAFQFQQARLNAENGRPNAAADALLDEIPTLGRMAAFQLGRDLEDGNDMPVDYEKSLRACLRAAEFDFPEASFNVGIAYYGGKGIRADPVQALGWFRRSADSGFARGAMIVGVMAARGHGMARDIELALTYLNRAAALGAPEAALMAEAVAAGAIPY